MPTFIFISGYFANNYKNKGWIKKDIKRLLIPYVTIQLTFILFMKYVLKSSQYNITIVTPVYVYWYLFALFIWSILIKYVPNKHIKKLIIISFVIGILSGYIGFIGTKLSLSRIIVFFPFYLMGFYFKGKEVNNILNKRNSIILLIIIGIITFIISKDINHEFLLCYRSYKSLDISFINGSIYRIFLYMIQTIMIFAFFSLVSNNRTLYSEIGAKTFSIYILHGFLVKYLAKLNIFYNNIDNIDIVGLFILSIIIVFIMSGIYLNKKEVNKVKN